MMRTAPQEASNRTRLPHMAWALAALLAGLGLTACGPGMIEGTEIEATETNVDIYDAVQRYRKALEERDVEALSSIISREYFENSGTTDSQEDDYGFEVLREKVLPVLRDNIKKVRVDVRVTDIKVKGERAEAEFEYFTRFLYSEAGKDGWVTRSDFNRLEFVREDGAWRIVSGL